MKTKYILSLLVLFLLGTVCNEVEQEIKKYTRNDEEKLKRLKKEGEKCDATVEKVEELSITEDDQQNVRISLEVMPRGEPSFGAKVEMVVPRNKIPRKGDDCIVYFNPKDRSDIIIDKFETIK